MIGSDLLGFRTKAAPQLSDALTSAAKNNALADGYRKGASAARSRLLEPAGRGFSRSAKDRMYAAQQEASGINAGAMASAAIESEDQQFNEGLRNSNAMLNQQSMLAQYGRDTDKSAIDFDRKFNATSGIRNYAMARAGYDQRIRSALLSQGLS
jgi:hypothetical protein